MLNYGYPHKEPCSFRLNTGQEKALCGFRETHAGLRWSCAPQMRYKQHLAVLVQGSARSLSGQQGKIPQIRRPLTSYTISHKTVMVHPCLPAASLSLGRHMSLAATAAILALSSPNFNEEKGSCVFACERHSSSGV